MKDENIFEGLAGLEAFDNPESGKMIQLPEGIEAGTAQYDINDQTDPEMIKNSAIVPKRVLVKYTFTEKQVEKDGNKN